ncbi:hypothetical protein [Paenibacillus apiarius]|uniref:Uncharacterized protein n=1 Tax=Paenibacillus apiarius TaxID=46240 RepID=A0ABT4DSW1_9BACL|nr:hypothetical protein [Paenibacillus apiarius]MCY9515738.1 hypothetical protein [Paenibacillus apiarius]MCY9520448.1 hypothetical protein [Paenibacillus apiarius]MCY9550582.1 hypothetical protein [Paenibacillus apiarius]MCY9559102.1 hypothetical protein [Paenibacillus apiarius]MCY9683103.1 hypothetical protein [Paenibacillus apiarius]
MKIWRRHIARGLAARIAKSRGVLEEEWIMRDQYDGLLFIGRLHRSRRLP